MRRRLGRVQKRAWEARWVLVSALLTLTGMFEAGFFMIWIELHLHTP